MVKPTSSVMGKLQYSNQYEQTLIEPDVSGIMRELDRLIFIYPVVCYRQTGSLTVRPDRARWTDRIVTLHQGKRR